MGGVGDLTDRRFTAHLTETRKGELAVLGSDVLWGLFPAITILSYQGLSPMLSLVAVTLTAAVFFAALLTIRGKWGQLATAGALQPLLALTLLVGLVFYPLLFFALRFSTAGNVALIAKMEVFSSFLFFHMWKREHISRAHGVGALLVVLAAGIVLSPKVSGARFGDFLVLAAVTIAPFGNFYQQRARRLVSSETIMFFRSAVAGLVLLPIALRMGEHITMLDFRRSALAILINGVLLFGVSKVLWLEAIHRISVAKANALGVLDAAFALIFAYLLLGDIPSVAQLLAFAPLSGGVYLLTSPRFS